MPEIRSAVAAVLVPVLTTCAPPTTTPAQATIPPHGTFAFDLDRVWLLDR
jgi:hypothetical protein